MSEQSPQQPQIPHPELAPVFLAPATDRIASEQGSNEAVAATSTNPVESVPAAQPEAGAIDDLVKVDRLNRAHRPNGQMMSKHEKAQVIAHQDQIREDLPESAKKIADTKVKHGKPAVNETGVSEPQEQEYVGKHRKEATETPTPIYDSLKQDYESRAAEAGEPANTQAEQGRPSVATHASSSLTHGELEKMRGDFDAIIKRARSWNPNIEEEAAPPELTDDDENIPIINDNELVHIITDDELIPIVSDEPEAMAQRRKSIFGRLADRTVGAFVSAPGRLTERDENETSHRKRNVAIGAGVVAVGALVAWKLGAFSGGGSHHSGAHDVLNGTVNSTNPHDAATTAGNIDFSHIKGTYPWDVLHNAGIPEDEIGNKLTDAAKAAHLPYQWHGTGRNQWIEVAGKSDTKSVMDMLGKYITK